MLSDKEGRGEREIVLRNLPQTDMDIGLLTSGSIARDAHAVT